MLLLLVCQVVDRLCVCALQEAEAQRKTQEKRAAAESRREEEVQRRQREVGIPSCAWFGRAKLAQVTLCRLSRQQQEREQQRRGVGLWRNRG